METAIPVTVKTGTTAELAETASLPYSSMREAVPSSMKNCHEIAACKHNEDNTMLLVLEAVER